MKKIRVLHQNHGARLLLTALEQLSSRESITIAPSHIDRFSDEIFSNSDVIIFSDVIHKNAPAIAEEARMRKVRLVYHLSSPLDQVLREVNRISRVAETSAGVRAMDAAHRTLSLMDVIVTNDERAMKALRERGYHALVIDEGLQFALRENPSRARAVSRNSQKKILFITPTFMWPHQHIGDVLARNLMEMGHDVRLFTVTPPQFHAETICMMKSFEEPCIRETLRYVEDPWKIPLVIAHEKPDLIMTVQGYVIPRQVLIEIQRRGTPNAVWFMDEPYDASRSASIGKYFTHVFLQDASTVAYHRKRGNANSFYLPHGCDPKGVHFAEWEESHKYAHDVLIVGSPFPKRIEYVEALRSAGIRVCVVGPGWKRCMSSSASGTGINTEIDIQERTVSLAEAARMYRGSRINLNIHRGENDASTNENNFRAESINCSAFYIAGSGAFQLVDDSRKGLADIFRIGSEIVTFSDIDDCVGKIRHYLIHEEERYDVARRGYLRACSGHTYLQRLEAMMDTIQSNPASHDTTHHRMFGYVQINGSPHLHNDLVQNGEVAVTYLSRGSQRQCRHISDSNKELVVSADSPFGVAINSALFDMPSDIYIICDDVVTSHAHLRSRVVDFTRDLNLGVIMFRNPCDSSITGCMIPARCLLEIGGFRFRNAGLSFEDYCYRCKNLGLVVKEIEIEGDSVLVSPLSHSLDAEGKEVFLKDWTENPADRMLADRVLRVAIEQGWKVNNEEGLAIMKTALSVCPSFLKGRKYVGEFLVKQGRAMEAKDHLRQVWQRDAENITGALLYAMALRMTGEDNAAFGVFEGIVSSEVSGMADRSTASYHMGLIHLKRREKKSAGTCFLHALSFDSSHAGALKELSMLNVDAGRYEEALEFMIKLNELCGSDEDMNDIGVLCWQVGRKQEAYEWLMNAHRENADKKNVLMNLAAVSIELGRSCEAKPLVEAYLQRFPSDKEMKSLLNTIRSLP